MGKHPSSDEKALPNGTPKPVLVIGGGLAGSEAAWQIAQSGLRVVLCEMRPERMTPAHVSDRLAELVCSNSLGSNLQDRAPGLLKAELRCLGSLLLACADVTAVPAGGALAVDREAFAQMVTDRVCAHPGVLVRRVEVTSIPTDQIVVVATGPLTSPALADQISSLLGSQHLYFYDAMAPIVTIESVDKTVAFQASRYGHGEGEGDYWNCPMNQAEYEHFVQALLAAEPAPIRDFEREDPSFFEACLPIEVLARRGAQALAFGPLRPVGLRDPRTGHRPYAVVQLRQDNRAGTLYNLVGFQTSLKWGDQERIFRLIPGLEKAEFVRFGQMHRNTFINSPSSIEPTLEATCRQGLFFAGQITGTEGYVGSVASGLVAGLNAQRRASGQALLTFPRTTMIGALCSYVSGASPVGFQPMKANLGLLPPLEVPPRAKRERHAAHVQRALADLQRFAVEAAIGMNLDDIT